MMGGVVVVVDAAVVIVEAKGVVVVVVVSESSFCKSGLETDPRPRPDRKKTRKDRTGGPGLSLSK